MAKKKYVINEDICIGCMDCVRLCNFGAIRRKSLEKGVLEMVIDPDKCMGCSMCARQCPLEAITSYDAD